MDTKKDIKVYDVTLREGAQSSGTAFTVEDKLRIMHLLDDMGVHYIEAGNPGSNPKDAEFFRQAARHRLKNAKLAAFGPTCHVGVRPEDDPGTGVLVQANTDIICIFGKCWDFHVENILKAKLIQNLAIIRDTILYLREHCEQVIFDAEHFFDGYKHNSDYALECLLAAKDAGADYIVLCDTNGGCFPHEIVDMIATVRESIGGKLGIHTHNDAGMADANTISAVLSGASMVQVTINGIGERCGNANLCTVVPNLQLKLDYNCLPPDKMEAVTGLSRAYEDISNAYHNPTQPYVGKNAFAHKAGMHIDGVTKAPQSFEHIPPQNVGNKQRIILSEIAGRAAILEKARRVEPSLSKDSPVAKTIVGKVKQMEFEGYQFEGADASFELLVLRELGGYQPFFLLKDFRVIVEEPAEEGRNAAAMIEVEVGGEAEITAALGNGPVNALDNAARKALERFYPNLRDMYLSDFKVRVLHRGDATASIVRVSIESRDKKAIWNTVGVSADIIQASWVALVDSLEYKMLMDSRKVPSKLGK